MPCFSRCSARRLAPCFMRVKTSTWCQSLSLIEMRQQVVLHLAADRVHLLRDRARRSGCGARPRSAPAALSRRSASALISSLKVAENSRLCFFCGSTASTLLTSWMKPMSSMRSASSSTKISTCERSSVRWLVVVEQAARRRDEDVDAAAELVDLRLHADAAEHHHAGQLASACRRCARFPRPAPRARASASGSGRGSAACRARRAPAGLAIRRCSSGRTKPAVLPVPVWAPPRTSPPERTAGMACAWIGVGVV